MHAALIDVRLTTIPSINSSTGNLTKFIGTDRPLGRTSRHFGDVAGWLKYQPLWADHIPGGSYLIREFAMVAHLELVHPNGGDTKAFVSEIGRVFVQDPIAFKWLRSALRGEVCCEEQKSPERLDHGVL